MATIVEHIESGGRYVLLGAGYGMYRSATGCPLGGDLAPKVESGTADVLAVCDAEGVVGWFSSKLCRIVSVDGEEPGAVLG